MTSDDQWTYDPQLPGWTRALSYPIKGTPASFELLETRLPDGQDEGGTVEMYGALPATPGAMRAAALTLLRLADDLGP